MLSNDVFRPSFNLPAFGIQAYDLQGFGVFHVLRNVWSKLSLTPVFCSHRRGTVPQACALQTIRCASPNANQPIAEPTHYNHSETENYGKPAYQAHIASCACARELILGIAVAL